MTTPGAGEGERWETRPTLVAAWEFWQVWVVGEGGRIVADFLTEADADLICKLHNHPWVPDLLIDHDAPVCEICGEGMAAHTEESQVFQDYMRLHNAREADQQTIANLETVVHAYKRAAENAEQALAAERERADKAEHERDVALDTANSFAKRILKAEAELQAEREKSARLEALAGLAAEMAEGPMPWITFKARYIAITTQAPEADHVGGLMSIPAYQNAPEARQ